MAKKEKIKKPKQIVFSEEIDSAINGYAIGLSFTGIGVFLLLKPEYFAIPVVSYIVGAIIGVFGVLGTGVELLCYNRTIKEVRLCTKKKELIIWHILAKRL